MSATRIYIIEIAPSVYEARLESPEGLGLARVASDVDVLFLACKMLTASGLKGPFEAWAPGGERPIMRISLDADELIAHRHDPPEGVAEFTWQ